MAITVNDKDLGMVTAYAYALAGGYTGTEAEFEALLGKIAEDLAEIENLSVQVQTLPAGSDATASYAEGVLTLGIPRGNKGETGDQGEIGPTPQLSVGTVTTGEPGTDAEVEITGTPEAPVLNFTIPRGDTGNITQAVRYDAAQTLTDAQKEQARENIDAADAGEVAELKSAKANYNTVGFNQWDEVWEIGGINAEGANNNSATTTIRSKNYIPVFDSLNYFFHAPVVMWVHCYDGTFAHLGMLNNGSSFVDVAFSLISGTKYLRFAMKAYGTTYNNDICINISQPNTSIVPYNGQYISYSGSAPVYNKVLQDEADEIIYRNSITKYENVSRSISEFPGGGIKDRV